MLYEVVHTLTPPVAKLLWRPRVTGLEHVPATGPVILASNHLSFADSVVIPCVAPRRVVFLERLPRTALGKVQKQCLTEPPVS